MEIELADLLAEIDAAVYVLDCLPNLEAQMVTERVEPFVRKLRAARPNCPIVLVENITYQDSYLVNATRDRATGSNRALAEAYGRLKNAGMRGLYYVPGDQLLGDDHEATVDGTHPTDLGMTRIAGTLEPVLRKVLNQH
jgi:lysophospholipase L1-like esterase